MFYITGDLHAEFNRLDRFCAKMETNVDDVMIVLGDAGINFEGGFMDRLKKERLSLLPVTLFCIHGNHEQRPATLPEYHEVAWHGGNVYIEDAYPNILFAKDGEVYTLNGYQTIVIGGAYSIDKPLRTPGVSWWEDEQPSEAIKQRVESQLECHHWAIDVVLSHTTPLKYEPRETFFPGLDQSRVDKSTETWLGEIESRLTYKAWYCGHFHINKNIDRIHILFESIEEFSFTGQGEQK